jgi:hypothetical protein
MAKNSNRTFGVVGLGNFGSMVRQAGVGPSRSHGLPAPKTLQLQSQQITVLF